MIYVLDVLIIFVLFALFGYLHSVMASRKFKVSLVRNTGDKIAFYRLFYNVISLITFLAVYYISPKPSLIIYDLPYPYDIIVFVLQIFALIGLLWSVKYIDVGEFTGFSQIKRYFGGIYNKDELDEHSELIVSGPFKFVRHPVYFFTILFLGLRPVMDLFYLAFFICLILYFYIGSIYEEKKLVDRFGVKYQEYQQKIPRIFPIKFK